MESIRPLSMRFKSICLSHLRGKMGNLIVLPHKAKLALKIMIHKTLGPAVNIIDDEHFNALLFRLMFGRKPDFEHPSTFNEHICARKLRDDAFDLWKYSDKYEARDYVRTVVGEEYLNECYGIYDRYEDIDFDALPSQFALRCTHGSGYNMVVLDKTKMNHKKASKKFDKWLNKNYYHVCRERNYARIKPRIECDRYLESHEADGLPELKVFCFAGKARFIGYNLCVHGKTFTNLYDENWNYLDIQKGYGHFGNAMIPDNREEIIRVAEKLSKPFEFVRVDLYYVDQHIYFSELTFFSGGGFVPFNPPEYDEKMARFFIK